MEEEKNKEIVEEQENDKTTEDETELDAHNEDETEVEDTDFDDGEEQKPKKEVKKVQNRKTNAQYAEERRKREQEIAKENFNKGMREALDNVNTFTGEKIEDDYDLEVYKNMKEAEKAGYDPLNTTEYNRFLKEKNKKEVEKQQEEEQKQKASNEKAHNEVVEFAKIYPKVNIDKLLKDDDFLDYADGKLGNKPLKDIYANYLKRKDRLEKQEEAELDEARKQASKVGSQTKVSGSTHEKKLDFDNMTDEEYRKYYQNKYK